MSFVRGTSRASKEREPESALCTVAANGEAICGCGNACGVAEPVSELCTHLMPSHVTGFQELAAAHPPVRAEARPGQHLQVVGGKCNLLELLTAPCMLMPIVKETYSGSFQLHCCWLQNQSGQHTLKVQGGKDLER